MICRSPKSAARATVAAGYKTAEFLVLRICGGLTSRRHNYCGCAVAVLLALTGCLFPEGRKVVSGHEYKKEALAFLDERGVTREETVATLGLPSWESQSSRVLLYLWETTFKWKFVPPENDLGIHPSETESSEKRKALLIAYDERGAVTAHTVRTIGKAPLEQVCADWAQALQVKR